MLFSHNFSPYDIIIIFYKGNILLIISVMIKLLVVIKIVEISISFIFIISFINEDE